MKNIKTHHRQDPLSPSLDAAGERLASVLLDGLDNIDNNTLQRLRAGREQAIEQHRMALAHAAQTGLAAVGHGTLGHPAGGDLHLPAWRRLGNIGMLIALLLGLWLIDSMQDEQSVQEAVEVDRVLLTDDLPPAAYLDPGFKHFLKLSFPAESR